MKCPKCGNQQFEPGKVQSTGQIHFRPKNTPFFTLSTNEVDISAEMCVDCGYILLIGNLAKLKKLNLKSNNNGIE
jgi:predicted nucleic-acid-binding Zn-ribbon protein